MVPNDRKYTNEHEWAKIEGDLCLVGITDHAQSELGDIVFVELPEIGALLDKSQSLAVVESVKAVSDVYCPAEGEVVEVNTALEDAPQLINEKPYETWIAKLKLKDEKSLDEMLSAEEYQKLLSEGE